jgi:hypothetical protein
MQQNRSSATGVHLALLAPAHVRLLSVEELPPLNASTAAVLFPDDAAVSAEEVDVRSITDVVVVDSKWGQAKGLLASDALRGLRHIRLNSYVTSYWRYHTAGVPSDGLCTVEAVFFLCREVRAARSATTSHAADRPAPPATRESAPGLPLLRQPAVVLRTQQKGDRKRQGTAGRHARRKAARSGGAAGRRVNVALLLNFVSAG